MSTVVKLIANADAQCRYLTPEEAKQMQGFMSNGERRLRLAKVLTESRDRIIKQAGKQLFQSRPSLVAPGGNAYGEKMTATCLRDMDYYLRLITYSVAAGENTPIQNIGLIGVKEMYRSLGTPLDGVAAGIRAMKDVSKSLMSSEDAEEVGRYFDCSINALE